MSFLEVPDRVGHLRKRVGAVDHRRELVRVDELGEKAQVVRTRLDGEGAELLSDKRRQRGRVEHAAYRPEPPTG
jgi:hypothetical protein